MHKIHSAWSIFALTAFALLWVCLRCSPQQAALQNATIPGELLTDTPTFFCLAFRWLITGDENANANVTVTYRKQGVGSWKPALPLLRIHREATDPEHTHFRAGNLFAGSVLNLEPDTPYEVHFALTDPDGGQAEKIIIARTRAIPDFSSGVRQVHLYPSGYSGARLTPSLPDLQTAAQQAHPGDVLLLHAGIYPGTIRISVQGTADHPITFRGAGDGEAILDGRDTPANILEANNSHFLRFEGLTIRNGYTGIKANGAQGLVVRNCRLHEIHCGIISYTVDASDWYIADNEIRGRIKNWYPRGHSSDTGVNLSGSGHIICYNRISNFWDGVSTDNHGENLMAWIAMRVPPQMDVDIYHNDISQCMDDGIEADDTLHNIRVWNNRIINTHTGLSAQPHLAGPIYFLGNCLYNITYAPLKLHNVPTGLLIFHNTCVSCQQGFESWPPRWQNATLRNNLFLGTRRYAMETGSPDPRTTLDYNGYGKSPDPSRLIAWSSDGGKTWGHYLSLADFHRATGQEGHGVLVNYSLFRHALPPREGNNELLNGIDLRLQPGSIAVDTGVRIPNVNDNFLGAAPDLGCYELGAPPTHYGPRSARPPVTFSREKRIP